MDLNAPSSPTARIDADSMLVDSMTIDVEVVGGTACYEIENTIEGVYQYTLRKKDNPRGLQKIVKSQDDKEWDDDPRRRNRSDALELVVAVFRYTLTGLPLSVFLLELLKQLGRPFAWDIEEISNAISEYLPGNADLENGVSCQSASCHQGI